ncbi:MAG: InlB B-repeat-containing protein [Anaeroplasma bactoclasticum]|nr:InlB B-repeat-containing protein [Anaeroplasma bactoclasticum]
MKKFFSMLLLLCGLVTISSTLVGVNAAEAVATFTASDVVNGSSYAKHENDDWVLTLGGNKSSVGSNSGNKAKCVLGTDYAYVGEPLSFDATTTNTCAIISKKAIANVKEVQYTCKDGGNGGYKTTDIYLVSSDSATSGFTQIDTKKTWSTSLTFEVNEEGSKYYALVFHLTTTSNFRIDEVVAKFMPNEVAGVNYYDVTYDTQGGLEIEAERVAENALAPKPADPKKEGFIFAGWYKEAACENEFEFDVDKITSDTTIYAKWEVDPYTHAIIDKTNFLNNKGTTSTGYADFNGSHSISGIVFMTNQVLNNTDIQFQANAGVLYNTVSISGNIKSITLDINGGEFSVSTSETPLTDVGTNAATLTSTNTKFTTSNLSDKYFYIKVTSSSAGHINSIDIAYEYVEKQTYTVSYNVAGGAFVTGKGTDITEDKGQATIVVLPTAEDLSSTLYKYTVLTSWSDGTTTYLPGASVEVSSDTTFSAKYEAPSNLTVAQALEVASLTGTTATTISFSTTATIKEISGKNVVITDDSTAETMTLYNPNILSSLVVGDVITATGKIKTYNTTKEYDAPKAVVVKHAYVTAFEAEQTKASLKLDGNTVCIRFGNIIPAAAYNTNATYGVVVSKTTTELQGLTKDTLEEFKTAGQAVVCTPVRVNAQGEEDANGEYYQFALVLTDVPTLEFDAVIYAAMYVIDLDNVFLAEVKSASVKSVATAYLEGDTSNFSQNTIHILNGIVEA